MAETPTPPPAPMPTPPAAPMLTPPAAPLLTPPAGPMLTPPAVPMPAPLSPADAGEALTVQRAAYLSEARAHADLDLPPLTETLEAIAAALTPTPGGLAGPDGIEAHCARENGRLVAAVRLRRLPIGEAAARVLGVPVGAPVVEIGRLVVAPDRQGQGLGSAMLRHAHARAAQTGHVATTLFTGEHSTGNLRFYAGHGYTETHRTRTPGGYDLVHLARLVRPADAGPQPVRAEVPGEGSPATSDTESRRNLRGGARPGIPGRAGCTP